MPQFAEKESSLLAKLKKSKPQGDEMEHQNTGKRHHPSAIINQRNVRFYILKTPKNVFF